MNIASRDLIDGIAINPAVAVLARCVFASEECNYLPFLDAKITRLHLWTQRQREAQPHLLLNVDGFKEVLVADDFGLASLPEEIWRARLAVLPSGLTSSLTSIEPPEEVLVGE